MKRSSLMTRRAALGGMGGALAGTSLLEAQQDPFRDHSRVPGIDELTTVTEFEGVALRLGLTKETYSSSSQLRIWCQRNGNRCYVPEWLLKEWGIVPDVGWS